MVLKLWGKEIFLGPLIKMQSLKDNPKDLDSLDLGFCPKSCLSHLAMIFRPVSRDPVPQEQLKRKVVRDMGFCHFLLSNPTCIACSFINLHEPDCPKELAEGPGLDLVLVTCSGQYLVYQHNHGELWQEAAWRDKGVS